MAEIDLVPADYRRTIGFRRWLRRFGAIYLALLLSILTAKTGLAVGVRARSHELEELNAALRVERVQRARLEALRQGKTRSERYLRVLGGLQGGIPAKAMFAVVDRALDGRVWFHEWRFRRAGELVDNDPKAVQRGYFVVLPMEQKDATEKAWLMHTHMELEGQAVDHSALAGFVDRLVDQPEIEEVRVLRTRERQYTGASVVDFELAVVVRTRT